MLTLFGDHHARTGALLLTLAALSAVPNTVAAAGIALARVQQRRLAQVGTSALTAVVVVPLEWVLMGLFGLDRLGVAILAGQGAMALILVAAYPAT